MMRRHQCTLTILTPAIRVSFISKKIMIITKALLPFLVAVLLCSRGARAQLARHCPDCNECEPNQFIRVKHPTVQSVDTCNALRKILLATEEDVCFRGRVRAIPNERFCKVNDSRTIPTVVCTFLGDEFVDATGSSVTTQRACAQSEPLFVFGVWYHDTQSYSLVTFVAPFNVRASGTPNNEPDRKPIAAKVYLQSASDNRASIVRAAVRKIRRRGRAWDMFLNRGGVTFRVERRGGFRYVVILEFDETFTNEVRWFLVLKQSFG